MIDYNKKSDEDLIELTLKDPDFFSYIINRYQDKLSLYIRRISNINFEDAQDILQEVFLKIYLNLNDYNSSLKFSSWIYRIAHNQTISRHRHLKSRPEGNSLDLDEGLIDRLSSEEDILQELDKKISRKNIIKILNSLDKKYRDVLVLKFLEEKSYQEISDIIKKPSGTVASMINKAKEKFRLEIQKQNINF